MDPAGDPNGRSPKDGERILAPSRRPDGTLRKPVRIRAGYVPQDEVALYQSKGSLLKKSTQPDVPPGYDPVADARPKTKAAKRNERKKEKKLQAALDSADGKGKGLDSNEAERAGAQRVSSASSAAQQVDSTTDSVTSQISSMSLSSTKPSVSTDNASECLDTNTAATDLDKKIRAIKKKIRLAEAQQKGEQQSMKPEQIEKLAKIDDWKEELKNLEAKKAALET